MVISWDSSSIAELLCLEAVREGTCRREAETGQLTFLPYFFSDTLPYLFGKQIPKSLIRRKATDIKKRQRDPVPSIIHTVTSLVSNKLVTITFAILLSL